MKNNIKMILKEASNKQEINDLSQNIINCVDTSKVLNTTKPAPIRKPKLVPYLISGIFTLALIVVLSISLGINNTNNINNPTIPEEPAFVPEVPVEYNEISLSSLEQFYSQFTVNDAYNIINIANTFNNVSFDKVDGTTSKRLTEEMEQSICNDTNIFIYNFEDMLKLGNNENNVLKNNTNTNYDYEYVIDVNSQNYQYHIYYNEVLTEEKNVDKDNYKTKSDLNGLLVINNNEYLFTGMKRIKNNKLTYTTLVTLDLDKYVNIEETFTINQDFTINYSTFNYKYEYHYGDKSKIVRITQNFGSNKETDNIRFVANEKEINEVKMTIKKDPNGYIISSIDSRDKEELTINKLENQYKYKFKNSQKEYLL